MTLGKWGLLDWNGRINPLATMIKCCHEFTAVSQGYMHELFEDAKGLQDLIRQEHRKATWNHQWNRYRSLESHDGYNARRFIILERTLKKERKK